MGISTVILGAFQGTVSRVEVLGGKVELEVVWAV